MLVRWVVPSVLCNMIRLIANKATPGLGLASSICRPKTRVRVIKAFVLLFLRFFCIKNQAAWLVLGRDS